MASLTIIAEFGVFRYQVVPRTCRRGRSILGTIILFVVTLYFGFVYPLSTYAQTIDGGLLSKFCDQRNIRGSNCLDAKQYSYGRVCNVELGKRRYSGKFVASMNPLLLVSYGSDCEPHATNWGGSVLFEKIGNDFAFRGYHPGFAVDECASIPRSENQDRLICITGYMGQGHLESSLAELVFTLDFSKKVKVAYDNFLSATDSTGAYGANRADCSVQPRVTYLGLDKLGLGPQANTVSLEIKQVDEAAIRAACRPGAAPPKEAITPAGRGEAYIPAASEKRIRVVVDLSNRSVTPADQYKVPATVSKLPGSTSQTIVPTTALRLALDKVGRRVALVIGNSRYSAVPQLINPERDSMAMGIVFRSVGFSEVIEVKDATKSALQKALLDFADRAINADWAVVYYAGHGMEVDGSNYLIPVDAVLKRDRNVRLEAVSLDEVVDAAAAAKKLRLVILDACRDNPFLVKMSRTVATRSIGAGLAQVEPQQGTLVAFAAKHGQTASDGEGQNSPFVDAMISHIHEPGVDVSLFFRKVRDTVLAKTANKQEPFVYGSLPGETLSFQPTN